jgi:uncharacterized repeat protein (TIGR01451 family)
MTSLFLLGAHALRAANLVQEFYLPMPEQQIYQALSTIQSGIGTAQSSTYSIVVTGNGTVIYYDQWEDGYETDLGNPTQPSTQIWGDGNDAHGIPPGFAHNPLGLPAGTVITLTNTVTLPRNPSQLLWDGGDRIGATKAIVVTHAGWPVNPGPVFAGAVSVLSTMDYGTNYISPVGQDLTNHLFSYVGLFVMAAQNGTAVTIDPSGNGTAVTNIVLNQGESYLVNGGVKKGGYITASEPVQADLVIGHVNGTYAADWFTLYPVQSWGNTYYTPVSSAATVNQPAYVYLYNPNPTNITINYNTLAGSGSFSVPGTNGVFQFQMPVKSGASFTSTGGAHFYALCTVAANNSSDTPWNWGFTLLPKAGLTTVADVGWAPGSANDTVDGSPVWVTTLGNTKVYVDYHGDTNGLLIDPNGNHYDTNFTVSTLQSLKIYDPSKDQTGMKVYTVDGTLLSAVWGEDADVAAPGNPYIDAGTTVLPFPVPLLYKSAVIVTDTPPAGLSIGDTIQYTVTVDNKGLLPLGNTVVIDAPSGNLLYLTNSTAFDGSPIPDSGSGNPFPLATPGYTIPVILSQGTSAFTYLCKVTGAGAVSNTVSIGGTTITADVITPPPTGGASVSLNFTDTNGVPVSLYAVGAGVYVTMTNAVGNTSSNSAQTISVTVVDLTHGDVETIPLLETGTNTGVFRNVTGLPTSTTLGLNPQDGILNVTPGDVLSVSYTDPVYGDSASNTAGILIPALTKQLYLSANGLGSGVQDLNRMDPVFYGHGPTRTSVDIGTGSGGGTGTSALAGYSTNGASKNLVWTNVIAAAPNSLLLVGINFGKGNGNSLVTNVVYGSTNMTLVASRESAAQYPVSQIWQMVNPPAGTNKVTIQVQATGTFETLYAVAATFTGVNTNSPLSAPTIVTNASSASLTNIVSSSTNAIVFDEFASDINGPTSAGSKQTVFYMLGDGNEGGASSYQTGATTVTNIWSWSGNRPSVDIAVSINPATNSVVGGGPATNATAFVQTPVFASSFVMPSNNFVTITNYITVTNGVMPANPNVTAMLQFDGATFLTLTNPVYSAASNTLVWSGVLSSNVTVPAGTNITYVISNGVPGTAFHVNYDSTNAPSKISLPASTVININTLAVYDAPYPGGNLVTTPIAGSTLYIRANVSDPFGSYDITSLGLAVTGPSPASSFSNTLNNANVVASDGGSKTYEFQWVTSLPPGGYNIAATANEGTEGVTDTAATSVLLTVLDLGTPSATVFTSGNNGTPTNSYPANSTVCVQVTDPGLNTNPATVQTIIVTVNSTSGDSEILALAETSTNTGIFTGCIPTSTTSGTNIDDGTVYAPVGSVLTATYNDPNNPSYSSSATATIQPAPGVPGVAMNKTVVSPSGGQAGTNQPVTYNLQVINTGSTALANVAVTDNFPPGQLSYASASSPPGTVGSGVLTWVNVGPLTPGQITNIAVTFTTLAFTGTVTNSATANAGTATNSSVASVFVSHSALNVTKLLLSPTNQPVAVGSNVVFRILVQNTGNTAIPTLPLEDYFSAAYFQFVSATIPPNGSGAGSLLWTNLAAAAPLAVNAVITNDVTMLVVGQGNPANNTAIADFAVDSFGNPVPAASGSTNVVTAAASINGHVFNDINQNGIFTNGDTGLAGVTLQLFTDPGGTGNPTNGTLVQIVTTDGNGYYELLNLNLGHYVLVETVLPGYASSAPPNGSLAFNLTNLTASTNNNFFQYQPSPSLYSTFNGTVWNDINGGGTNYPGQAGLASVEVDLVQDLNSNGVADAGEPVVGSTLSDANGNYSFAAVTPGYYVIRQDLPYGYYTTGDSQSRDDSQISLVTTNGIVSTNNSFFDRLLPIAVNDTNSAFYLVPVTIYPLTNDISPNGDPLTISNAVSANGIVVINPGATNLTFTPTNTGVAIILYTNADAHGGTSGAVIYVNVTALADVGLGKSAAGIVSATSNLVYTISVTNFGPSAAGGVTVTDAVPAGAAFVAASGDGADSAGVVTWSLGTLADGAVSNVTLTVTAPANGSLTNVASVGSPTGDPNPSNNTNPPVVTAITPVADVAVGKTGPAGVTFNTGFSYTIAVTNFGPSTATTLSVTDNLPVGLAFVSSLPATTTNAVGQVVWNLGTLASGTTTDLTLNVISTLRGTVTNLASAGSQAADPDVTNNVSQPVLTLITNLPPSANPDHYTISENSGTNIFAPLANDVVNNPGGSLVIIAVNPTNGTAVISGTNVLFVPATNFVGTATIGYTITDGVGGTNSSLITVTVTNIPPVANPDAFSVGENTTNRFNPLLNDVVMTPGGVMAIIAVSPTNGAAVILGGTNVQFIPNLNFTGTATIGYTITDGVGGTNSSLITVTVTNVVSLQADLAVFKTGPTNAVAGSNLTYTVTITNLGPDTASNIVASDQLPAVFSFVSASGGGTTNAGNLVTWSIVSLAKNAATNLTVTAVFPGNGNFTNIAFASASTFDPNPTNNNGTSPSSQVKTLVAAPQFALSVGASVTQIGPNTYLVGTNALNRQTGLYEEDVTVTNTGVSTVAGVRLLVGGLRSGVTLYNATGTNAGTPYAEYDLPLNPSNTVTFALEFYNPSRLVFTNTLTVVAILPAGIVGIGTNGIAVTNVFMDTRIAGDTRFVIEFATVPGAVYTIIYSDDDMATWQVATPSITANANITQWYDDGPPKTVSPPASISSRFYRVIKN